MSEGRKGIVAVGALSALIWALLRALLGRVSMMPEAAAEQAAIVDGAFGRMLDVTLPIFAIVVAVLLYSVLRFRAGSDAREGARFSGSPGGLVEGGWIALSTVLTLGLAAYGTEEFLRLRGARQADVDVEVRAAQWSWEFYYPEQKAYSSQLLLPLGKRVRILLRSEDVVHSLWIPAFRLKQDALPGRVTTMIVTPTKSGEYDVVCAELCGLDHTAMRAKAVVLDPEEFKGRLGGEAW